jgi:hypothetical protein
VKNQAIALPAKFLTVCAEDVAGRITSPSPTLSPLIFCKHCGMLASQTDKGIADIEGCNSEDEYKHSWETYSRIYVELA